MNRFLSLTTALVPALLAAPALADGPASVRVVHASPDAPAVDVLVNDAEAFDSVAFTDVTDYAELPAGTYNVKVVAAADNSIVAIEADLALDADTRYTVAAVNVFDEIMPIVLVDDDTVVPGAARVRFVHASPNAPGVDIALAGGDVLIPDTEFMEASDILEVPAGTYDLEVRPAGVLDVVLPLPGIELQGGTTYTVFAFGLLNGDPALEAGIAIDAQAPAKVRVAHGSPDAPPVDILVDGGEAFGNVAFTDITEYACLPAGTYNVQVVAAADNSIVAINADLTLEPGIEYTVAAVNLFAAIEPLVLVDDNTVMPDMARVRFVHASPNAPAVDVALAGGDVLFGDVEFKEFSNYLMVPGGMYDLEVRLAGQPDVVLPLPGVALDGNATYTVFAKGLVKADPPLQAVLAVDRRGSDVFGDLNDDFTVDHADISILLDAWGTPGCEGAAPCRADLDGDGTVGPRDLAELLDAWTP